MSAGEVLDLARARERDSEHPVARAIRRAPQRRERGERPLELVGVRSIPGMGVAGVHDGRRYRIGRPEWAIAGAGGDSDAAAAGGASRCRIPDARVVVLLAREGEPLAWLGFEDPLRPDAAEAMAALRGDGLALEMVSGDPSAGAPEVARSLGLACVVRAALPAEKVARVHALQQAGHRVAVVGDGVNDGPVLRAGEVSVAMGSACDLSRLGASAVLLRDDLSLLPRSVRAARRMRRIAAENVAWAIAYNVAVLPLAVTGHLPPWLAALGMSTSSLVVVLNALRAGRLEPAREGLR